MFVLAFCFSTLSLDMKTLIKTERHYGFSRLRSIECETYGSLICCRRLGNVGAVQQVNSMCSVEHGQVFYCVTAGGPRCTIRLWQGTGISSFGLKGLWNPPLFAEWSPPAIVSSSWVNRCFYLSLRSVGKNRGLFSMERKGILLQVWTRPEFILIVCCGRAAFPSSCLASGG